MNAARYLLLTALLVLPLLASAQKIGKQSYKVSTGDTTKIVSRVNTGLTGPEFEFLFSTKDKVVDSLYNEIQPDLTPSKAVKEVNDMLNEIERDQAILKAGNTSLSYRLSTEYIAANKKEKSARAYADSLLREQKRMSQNDLISKYLTYGDKPSYFANGMPVKPEITKELMPGDVVSRDLRTNTDNPNGEIWLVLTEKAMRRLKLPMDSGAMPENNNNVRTENTQRKSEPEIVVNDEPKAPTATELKEDTPKRSVKRIKAEQEARRNKENNDDKNKPVQQTEATVDKSKTNNTPPAGRKTIVRSRTVNNEPVEVKND